MRRGEMALSSMMSNEWRISRPPYLFFYGKITHPFFFISPIHIRTALELSCALRNTVWGLLGRGISLFVLSFCVGVKSVGMGEKRGIEISSSAMLLEKGG